MPYIYSLAGMTYHKDYTIMRPLVMGFSRDNNVNDISDQYMFGPAIMVAPVYEYGARNRMMYFPENSGWYDLSTGDYIEGGCSKMVDAPYERIPLFVRAGSILPVGPEMQYADEKSAELITLFVYAGADGEFSLYEDEGDNYNYEKNEFATIPFSYNDDKSELVIGDRTGRFNGMIKERRFKIVKVDKNSRIPFNPDINGTVVNYNGNSKTITL